MRIDRSVSLATVVGVFAALTAPAALAASDGSWFGSGSGDKPKASAKTKSPTVVANLTDGTKRLVSSTTGIFKPKTVTIRKSGLTGTKNPKKSDPPKQGFFQSMLHPEPPPPPKTIKEWMSLKQIHP
jgi:hypothetical protein